MNNLIKLTLYMEDGRELIIDATPIAVTMSHYCANKDYETTSEILHAIRTNFQYHMENHEEVIEEVMNNYDLDDLKELIISVKDNEVSNVIGEISSYEE